MLLPVPTGVQPWFEHALIALLALAVGLSFGLSYGLETHTSYLLHPLREINPTFLQFDWLAAHTELVHKSFALIIRALSILGPLPWTVAIANVVLVDLTTEVFPNGAGLDRLGPVDHRDECRVFAWTS